MENMSKPAQQAWGNHRELLEADEKRLADLARVVMPTDVERALEGVEVPGDVSIDEIQYIMAVKKNTDDPPDVVRFALPNGTTLRYVLLDSLPPQLKSVVHRCLSLKSVGGMTTFDDFAGSVDELYRIVHAAKTNSGVVK